MGSPAVGWLSPSETANQNLANGALNSLGAGVGVAIGAATGGAGAGAAIGAGAGLLTGTSMATYPAYASEWHLQRRYDMAYQQCMCMRKGTRYPVLYAAGHAYVPPPPPPRQ